MLERFHSKFRPVLARIYRVLLLSRLPKGTVSPRKDFLLKEKDVFETRNTRHRPTARYRFGLDSAGEEDVPSDVHFDLFDARKWIHVAARRDTENWAVRKIPSLFGEREKGIHSFGNWTPARRKEISLPLNLRGTERDSLVSAKVPSPPSFSLFPPSLSRSLRLSSESNEPLLQDRKIWSVQTLLDASLTFFSRLIPRICRDYSFRKAILRETRIHEFSPPFPPFVTSSWNQSWRGGGV